jgi:SAM-dependent methyltransferase
LNSHKKASFDAAAATYDDVFTLSKIGTLQRSRVYHWLDKAKIIKSGSRVFELNCGTGFDAEYFYKNGCEVTATDASTEMIKVAKTKRNSRINFYQKSFEDISLDKNVGKSDFVFSNFGGLNCLNESDLRTFFKELAEKQKSDSYLAVVIMPEHCWMENNYFLLKGQFSKINRRSRKSRKDHLEVDVNGEKIKTFYHSPWAVKQLLFKYYKVELVKPVAQFLPPSYLEPFFKKRGWLLKCLNFLEWIYGRFSFLAKTSDHYIIIAKRR